MLVAMTTGIPVSMETFITPRFISIRVLVRVHAVLKVMSRVKMKSYYRAAINAVRPRLPAHQTRVHVHGVTDLRLLKAEVLKTFQRKV